MGTTIPIQPQYSADYLERCREITDRALADVPFYKAWRARDIGGRDPLARLAALPLVDKAVMREWGPEGFVDPRVNLKETLARGEVEMVHTSGSTGDRVSNVWCQPWWNASEEASWKLNAHAARLCDRVHPEAILASPLCVGFPCEEGYLDQSRRTLGRFLFLNERMDSAGWTPPHMTRMLGELEAFRPVVLEAAPSYLARLCRFALETGWKGYSPGLIVLTFENPSRAHLRLIRSVFGSPVASSYGATEAGYVFMECECGRLHQNTACCHVDFIPFRRDAGGPAVGSILVTPFHNPWRVLLRFDIGDIVRVSSVPCPCGRREGLTLDGIEGRGVNLTLAPDGTPVTQDAVDRLAGGVPGLADYQLVQETPRRYRIRFAALGEAEPVRRGLLDALREAYGPDSEIGTEQVGALTPDPPGKARLCKPLIPVNAREYWEKGT